MKGRHALLLALTTGLAFGCAAARAQDAPGNPPPAPPPDKPAPADDGMDARAREEAMRERVHAAFERVRAAEARAADARTRLDQLTKNGAGPQHPDVVAANAALDQATRELDEARARVDEIAGPGGPGAFRPRHPRGPMGRGPGGPGMPPDGMGPRGRMGRPNEGPPPPPPPSVEERLAQLERAVREMHDMFERHHVDQAMRDRAEQEMRARALGGPDTRPMQPGGPMAPGGPGGPQGGGAGAPGGPTPRPPMARPDARAGGTLQPDPRAAEEMRAQMEAKMQEAHQQMQAAQQRIDDLSHQLADTQAALKKAQDELESLRPKK